MLGFLAGMAILHVFLVLTLSAATAGGNLDVLGFMQGYAKVSQLFTLVEVIVLSLAVVLSLSLVFLSRSKYEEAS